jgi:hypothetical protein
MDHGERIAKTETAVDALQVQLSQIQFEQIRLRESLDNLRNHTDQRFYEMQQNMDRRFFEAQQNTDRRFAEQREYTERGFAELRSEMGEIRKENARTMRWLTGLTITTAFMLIGMFASVLVKVIAVA